jgi:hypothetical protein
MKQLIKTLNLKKLNKRIAQFENALVNMAQGFRNLNSIVAELVVVSRILMEKKLITEEELEAARKKIVDGASKAQEEGQPGTQDTECDSGDAHPEGVVCEADSRVDVSERVP